jgi:hypothetical protein
MDQLVLSLVLRAELSNGISELRALLSPVFLRVLVMLEKSVNNGFEGFQFFLAHACFLESFFEWKLVVSANNVIRMLISAPNVVSVLWEVFGSPASEWTHFSVVLTNGDSCCPCGIIELVHAPEFWELTILWDIFTEPVVWVSANIINTHDAVTSPSFIEHLNGNGINSVVHDAASSVGSFPVVSIGDGGTVNEKVEGVISHDFEVFLDKVDFLALGGQDGIGFFEDAVDDSSIFLFIDSISLFILVGWCGSGSIAGNCGRWDCC